MAGKGPIISLRFFCPFLLFTHNHSWTEKGTRFQLDSHGSARFTSLFITTLPLLLIPITNYIFCWNCTQLQNSCVIREGWPSLSASQQMKCGRAPCFMVWTAHNTPLLEYCKLTLFSPFTLNCSLFYSSQYPWVACRLGIFVITFASNIVLVLDYELQILICLYQWEIPSFSVSSYFIMIYIYGCIIYSLWTSTSTP